MIRYNIFIWSFRGRVNCCFDLIYFGLGICYFIRFLGGFIVVIFENVLKCCKFVFYEFKGGVFFRK